MLVEGDDIGKVLREKGSHNLLLIYSELIRNRKPGETGELVLSEGEKKKKKKQHSERALHIYI